MRDADERLELVDRLISNVRATLKRGGPDACIFAGEVLRDLQRRRDALTAQMELELAGAHGGGK